MKIPFPAIALTCLVVSTIAAPQINPTPKPNTKPVVVTSQEEANIRAFLDTIAAAEVGTVGKEGYRKLVFGGKFDNFARHPNRKQCAPINQRIVCSTAAGRYQIMNFNLRWLQRAVGRKDFSPETQDKMALEFIKRKGAFNDVKAGRFEIAARKVGNIWASFPDNSYRQNPKSMAALKRIYLKRKKVYVSRPSP